MNKTNITIRKKNGACRNRSVKNGSYKIARGPDIVNISNAADDVNDDNAVNDVDVVDSGAVAITEARGWNFGI